MEDCHRISDCDPLQALYEQEPLANRAEDIKAVCKGLPHDPIITPSLHCELLPGSATEHMQALLGGLSVKMSLDPTDQDKEEFPLISELTGSLLHAQDTGNLTGGVASSPKLGPTFPLDPSPSLATPSTPASYCTPHHYSTSSSLYTTQGGAQSPASSTSDTSLADQAGDEFKDLHLGPFGFPVWSYPRLLHPCHHQ